MALTRALVLKVSSPEDRREETLPVAASTRILPGMQCCLNSSGYLVEASDLASGELPCICLEQSEVDNTDGDDGDENARVMIEGEFVGVINTTPLVSHLGSQVYATDGDSLTVGAGTNLTFGTIVAYQNVGDPGGRTNVVRVKIGLTGSFVGA